MSGPGHEATPALPQVPHLASEFLLWLWWITEQFGRSLDLGEEIGCVDLWVDTRLSFRVPGEDRATVVLTGDNPSVGPEARAALAGGKVPRDLALGLRREEREFTFVLRAPRLDVAAARLPQVVRGEDEAGLYDRMFLYEELHRVLEALFLRFARVRASPVWEAEVLPSMRAWVGGREAAAPS
ncbi:MAG: hypothetical protein JXB39_15045 [Deltaproteobacteria bacterium]|nr:hypothetical protein [Deltaproteobacteria bacterium]